MATLYLIIDLFRQDITRIPDVKTCTDTLQMWHVRKPMTDEPLLFSEIAFVKHDPERPIKRDLCASAKHHNPIPDFANTVSNSKLQKIVNLYDVAGLKLPVLETIRSNNFAPVVQKQHSDINLQSELFDIVRSDTVVFLGSAVQLESEDMVRHYRTMVEVDLERAKYTAKNPRLQSKTAFWFEQRTFRITASTFGTFCRLKPTTDAVKTFEQKKEIFHHPKCSPWNTLRGRGLRSIWKCTTAKVPR